MPKHENNALQKKFTISLKGTFSVECAPCMGYTWPVKKVGLHALHYVHVISHVK